MDDPLTSNPPNAGSSFPPAVPNNQPQPPILQQPMSNPGYNNYAQPGMSQQNSSQYPNQTQTFMPSGGYSPIVQQPMNTAGYNNVQPGMSQQNYYQYPNQTQAITPGAGFPPPPMYIMPTPLPPVEGVPVGLELLIQQNLLFVKQRIELLEVISGIETPNRYDIFAGNSQRIYTANETSGFCALCCGGPRRPFKIDILDFFGRTVLILDRPCDCCLYLSAFPCGCCICGQLGGDMTINLPDGTLLGQVVHVLKSANCTPNYEIRDESGTALMSMTGPGCGDCCGACGVVDFPITTINGEELGCIRKTFAGFVQEFMTDADNFGVNFPSDLNVKWKALILGAVFLIDFMYFESSGQQGQQSHRHHY